MASTAPPTWTQPGERRATSQYRNGTITMSRLVMKPLLPGVVHCRPMVCVAKATNRKRPSTAPYSQSRRRTCLRVRGMMAISSRAAARWRHSRYVIGPVAPIASLMTTKLKPHTTATVSSAASASNARRRPVAAAATVKRRTRRLPARSRQ